MYGSLAQAQRFISGIAPVPQEILPDACLFADVCFLPLSLCWNFKFGGFMRNMVNCSSDLCRVNPVFCCTTKTTFEHTHVPPKQVPSRGYFAEPPSLHPALNTAQDDYDYFKEMPINHKTFSPIAECCVD